MLSLLLAALLSSPAQAHGGGTLSGAWRVHTVKSGETIQAFPDALLGGEQNITYGRWLWVFGANSLTIATQLSVEDHDDIEGNEAKATRDAAWAWCQAQITVPLSQNNGHLTLPNRIQTSGHAGRFDSKGEAFVDGTCAIQLTGVAALEIVDNPAESPSGAVTLANEAGSLQIVLVPDGSAATLDRHVKRIEEHLKDK